DETDVHLCTSLRVVYCGGEALQKETLERFCKKLPHARLTNEYGPTEAAVACTCWDCDPTVAGSSVPIGFPTPGNALYLLNEAGKPVTAGEIGEIAIGSLQVARGYWKRPELTSERFVPDPFSRKKNAKMYRTGDLAKLQPS